MYSLLLTFNRWVFPFGDLRFIECVPLPKLFAAYHVLRRYLVPRHPSQALIRFKFKLVSYSKILRLF